MNHIGDTNKMVSETPISDSTPHNVADLGMQIRRLERKLNAASVEIEEKRKDVVWLATEKAKLENYVMRLEEAGDEIEMILLQYASRVELPKTMAAEQSNLSRRLCVNWRKAKEDKL